MSKDKAIEEINRLIQDSCLVNQPINTRDLIRIKALLEEDDTKNQNRYEKGMRINEDYKTAHYMSNGDKAWSVLQEVFRTWAGEIEKTFTNEMFKQAINKIEGKSHE